MASAIKQLFLLKINEEYVLLCFSIYNNAVNFVKTSLLLTMFISAEEHSV